MRRVLDYRENAKACRDLARKMPPAHREQLEQIAREWERLAEAREAQLTSHENNNEILDPAIKCKGELP